MNNPDTDWIKPGVQAVMTLQRLHPTSGFPMIGTGFDSIFIAPDLLSPLPPPLSPTAQRVVEAAMERRAAQRVRLDGPMSAARHIKAEVALADAADAHAEHLATLRPADPLAVAMELAMDALNEASLHFAGHGSKVVAESKVNGARPIVSAAILLIERGGKGEG